MPQNTQHTPSPPPPRPREPAPPASRPAAARLWIALALCAALLAVAGLHYRRALLDRFSLNRLYYLGHMRQWQDAYARLDTLPSRESADPYALRIRLEIFLHLAKAGEALDLIDRHRDLFAAQRRDLVGLQQTAAFVCILTAQPQRALALFRNHPRSPLSAAMARLIAASSGKSEIGPREIDRLDSLIEKEMIFHGPYSDLARYLFARRYLNRGETDRAIELLEGICGRYPHQAAFHYDLAGAYLTKRRFDLACIHFAVAHNEMRRETRRVPPGAADRPLFEDEEAFRRAVLEQALRCATTRSPEDFWRLLRGLRGVLDNPAIVKLLELRPHRLPLAAIHEWSAARTDYGTTDESAAGEKLRPLEKSILSAIARLTREPVRGGARSLSVAVRPGSRRDEDVPSTLSLRAVTVLSEPVGLLAEGDTRTYSVPAVSTGMIEAAVLVKLRAFPRRDVYGGCGVRVGTDRYWIYPTGVGWYAFALPPLPGQNVQVEIEATDYAIPGYTEPGDTESRRIHVEAVMGCYLEALGFRH